MVNTFRQLLGYAAILLAILPLGTFGAELPQLWSQALGTSMDSSPAIDANGALYVTCSGYTNYKDLSGGKLVALSPQGKIKWEFKTFCDIKSSPALGADGVIYFGGRDRKFYAISPQGKEKWTFATEAWIDSSAAIATDGTIYFGGWDTKFYALNLDGSRKWEFATGGPIDSSPAIAADGSVCFGSHDHNFYALNPDGSRKWVFTTGGPIICSPALNCDGTIYFTSVDGHLYALNGGGAVKWRVKTGGVRASSPVLDPEGNIYLGINKTIQCFTPDGVKKWEFGSILIDGAAAAAEDGTVYVGLLLDNGVGSLFAFDLAGKVVSYANLERPVTASPVIANDGTVYIGSGKFHAFKANAGPAKSCWPRFRGNAAQNGRINRE